VVERSVATMTRLTMNLPVSRAAYSVAGRDRTRPPGPSQQGGRPSHGWGSRHCMDGSFDPGVPMLEDLDDEELLVLSARRPEAFGTFYERHAEPLLRFFAR